MLNYNNNLGNSFNHTIHFYAQTSKRLTAHMGISITVTPISLRVVIIQ